LAGIYPLLLPFSHLTAKTSSLPLNRDLNMALSKNLNAFGLETKFTTYKNILTDIIIKQIAIEESQFINLTTGENIIMPGINLEDNEAFAKRKKRRGIGDPGINR
jgi:hypothetical protein